MALSHGELSGTRVGIQKIGAGKRSRAKRNRHYESGGYAPNTKQLASGSLKSLGQRVIKPVSTKKKLLILRTNQFNQLRAEARRRFETGCDTRASMSAVIRDAIDWYLKGKGNHR